MSGCREMMVTREIGPSDDRRTLEFVWHGGAYIEVREKYRTAMEVINVWNAYSDTPRIPRTMAGLADKVDDWILEYPEQSLHHDVIVNW